LSDGTLHPPVLGVTRKDFSQTCAVQQHQDADARVLTVQHPEQIEW